MQYDYQLLVNDEPRLSITIESPAWFPVRPRLKPRWLRFFISQAFAY
jgi:hypothetical protein